MLEQVLERLHALDEVVRRDVGRHAHRDAGRAVDEQVRERGGQDDRLGHLAVVVGLEVDGVLVDLVRHRERGGRHAALGVAHGRGAGVQRPEVAVPVDDRQAHRPALPQPHERVVDRGVAVGVQLAHHVADDARALHVPAVGTQVHVVHRVEDAALHGLQPVPRVRDRPGVDHRVRVLEEARLHLLGDVDVGDLLDHVLIHRRLGYHVLPTSVRVPPAIVPKAGRTPWVPLRRGPGIRGSPGAGRGRPAP